MKLIVGLGNPGKDYENTRHNIGFMSLDKIAQCYNATFMHNKFDGIYAEIIINNEKYLLLKPQRYMNLSGEVVIQYVNYYKINIEDILVISDDLDMPLGKIKLKLQGSSGGHNGLKNIELHLGTQNYKRLKIGISNDKSIETKNYVLGHLSDEEQEIISNTTDKVVDIFKDYVRITFSNLMNKYNQ